MNKLPSFADIFKEKARKYNHFQAQDGFYKKEQSCKTCIRKYLSYPYACNDGLDQEKDHGPECINWTNNKNCKVD
ncbi:MAG: hypothetical protein ACFFCI_23835 [Promethearchaeota archaeon]